MSNNNEFEFANKKPSKQQEEVDGKASKKHTLIIVGVVILSLILPMIGFALYLKWRESRPMDAKYPGYATIVSVAFGYTLLFYWLFIIN